MKTYSVSDAAKMLGVNEETVRRWIRKDGSTLKANRGRGRAGSTLQLEDIISFANEPPRTYLKSLIFWLDTNGIEYQKIKDNTIEKECFGTALSKASSTMILGAAANPANLAVATVGAITGTAISTMAKKSQVPFTIKLASSPELPFDGKEQIIIAETTEPSTDKTASDLELKAAEVQSSSLCDGSDIKLKIVDEQIKLIKLKQELAQIQAQISVTEGQIEYYNLLLQNN